MAKKGEQDKVMDRSAVDPASARASASFERALNEFFVERDGQLDRGADIHALHSAGKDETVKEYLSFRLSDELFAVSILFIKEIIKPPMFTDVPRTDPVVLGILSLRGTIVPVVDLRLLLGLGARPMTRQTRTLIVNSKDELIGLLVDEVRHVIRLREEDIEPPPAVFGRTEVEHMQGVGRHEGDMFTLIDLHSVVDLDRYIQKGPGGVLR